jgi:hypothetical protein
MANRTTPTAALVSLLATRYGVGALEAPALAVQWAAEHLADTIGHVDAMAAWRKLNAKRHRAGIYTSTPDYGSKLWGAFAA